MAVEGGDALLYTAEISRLYFSVTLDTVKSTIPENSLVHVCYSDWSMFISHSKFHHLHNE